LALLGLAVTTSGCGDRALRERGEKAAEKLIVDAIGERRLSWKDSRRSVALDRATSAAVPGLYYYQGLRTPPNTYDILLALKAGAVSGRASLLRSTKDWATLVGSSGWVPANADAAMLACEEVVSHVFWNPRAPFSPRFYHDSTSLQDGPRQLAFEPGRTFLLRHLQGPVVIEHRAESKWEITLWAMEWLRSVQYRCSIGGRARTLDVHVSVSDSLQCGFEHRCGFSLEGLEYEYEGTRRR
jgi:hypothetical protein